MKGAKQFTVHESDISFRHVWFFGHANTTQAVLLFLWPLCNARIDKLTIHITNHQSAFKKINKQTNMQTNKHGDDIKLQMLM